MSHNLTATYFAKGNYRAPIRDCLSSIAYNQTDDRFLVLRAPFTYRCNLILNNESVICDCVPIAKN